MGTTNQQMRYELTGQPAPQTWGHPVNQHSDNHAAGAYATATFNVNDTPI